MSNLGIGRLTRALAALCVLSVGIVFDPASVRSATEPEEVILDLGSGVQLEMVRIPAGEFMMGETDWSRALIGLFAPHDLRARQVTITKAFYLGKYEVTVGQFRRFVEDSGYRTDAETGRRSWKELKKGCYTTVGGSWGPNSDAFWRNPGFPQGSDHPVTCISWYDAVEFCRWLSGKTGRTVRLPTEGELEYGQRALTVTRYYWGKRPADYVRDPRLPIGYWANVADAAMGDDSDADLFLTGTEMRSLTPEGRDDGYGHTAPVGKFYPNPRGLYDAIGNVWEYTLDWAGEDPARTDPRGPEAEGVRSMRGGSWLNSPDAYRPSYRPEIEPGGRTSTRGMRVLVEE
jgi:formylglycine-generating enzyme required for sulfatase activity